MSTTPRRLASENITVKLRPVDAPGAATHDLDVAISYDIRDRRIVEIAFVTRGKVGGGMDLMFTDLGMQLSRAIQGRDIDTGEPSSRSALNLSNEIYAMIEGAAPCPICNGVEGCDHSKPERSRAASHRMMLGVEGLKDSPHLAELVKLSIVRFHAMSPEDQERELAAQRESWGRQDMD